ncbi:MAG: cytochrome P450 [Gemmataceae bacterium]|nr:cytochrome P450 [Gemmataceae bacterium]
MGRTSSQLPPGPRGLAALRAAIRMYQDPLRLLQDLPLRHGDVVHLGAGRTHVCILSHPDQMRDVLVTHNKNFVKASPHLARLVGDGLFLSNGEFHMRQRRLLQPGFHRDRLTGYGPVMTGAAEQRSSRWQPGVPFNLHREMLELTQVVVAKALLGTDLEVEADHFAQAMTTALEADLLLDRLPLPGAIKRLFSPSKRFLQARAQLDDTIRRAVDEHRRDPEARNDLLTMLLRARDTEGGTGGLTDAQVRDEAVTLFMAGHETTGAALTWTWYVLAQHPEAEAKVHAEVEAVVGNRRPEAADIPRLEYLRQVVSESLRLYPPFWVLRRIAVDEYQVGDYTVPAGTVILLNTWALHHDPRWYPEPWRFDPARMSAEAIAGRDRYTYVPFAAGPRECIGEHFAWMELILVIATVCQRWRLRLAPGHAVTPVAAVSLRPRGGMPMIAELRKPG